MLKNQNEKSKLTAPEQKVSYGLGWQFGRHLQTHNFEGLDMNAVTSGMIDCFSDKASPFTDQEVEIAYKLISQRVMEERAEQAAMYGRLCQEYLEKNKSRNEVQVTDSGLQFEVIVEGNGRACGTIDKVLVHYHGTLIDGSVFDSSIARGEPLEIAVQSAIAGWTEALQLMKERGKMKVYVPGDLAYGDLGKPPRIPGKAALIFDLELIKIL